jgi:ubiquinone/menaquinone biosynthesis C-methylase UbiE
MSLLRGDTLKQIILPPRQGYDLTAAELDSWYWSHFWRKNEAPIVLRWLKSLPKGLGLDAGAGTGFYYRESALFHHRCLAIDLSLRMLALYERRAPRLAMKLAQADITALPFRSTRFDWALCTRVLSHVECVKGALQELGRVIRRGREILLSDVHPDHPYTCTSIRLPAATVKIATYKHSFESLTRAAEDCGGFRILELREYRLEDLIWRPPQENFDKIYDNPDRPIFYICKLLKL